MELDEMKLAWQELDARVANTHTLALQLVRDGHSDKLRRSLRSLHWGQSAQIAFGVAAILWGVTFWSTHLADWRAVVCGVVMQVFGILMAAFAGRLLYSLKAIDYAAPVVEIQRRLAALGAWRVRVEAPAFVLLGAFVWIPAVLMLMLDDTARVGVDMWRAAPGLPLWLAMNGVFAVALAALAFWLLRRFGHARWLRDNFTGSAIRRAEAVLAEVARFERE
ncbi:MAG: hypothetical protein JSR56_11350 [Proteobacteria bacterium]|nr:hypothetical protein [Pseudomonadota bacterium]